MHSAARGPNSLPAAREQLQLPASAHAAGPHDKCPAPPTAGWGCAAPVKVTVKEKKLTSLICRQRQGRRAQGAEASQTREGR